MNNCQWYIFFQFDNFHCIQILGHVLHPADVVSLIQSNCLLTLAYTPGKSPEAQPIPQDTTPNNNFAQEPYHCRIQRLQGDHL